MPPASGGPKKRDKTRAPPGKLFQSRPPASSRSHANRISQLAANEGLQPHPSAWIEARERKLETSMHFTARPCEHPVGCGTFQVQVLHFKVAVAWPISPARCCFGLARYRMINATTQHHLVLETLPYTRH